MARTNWDDDAIQFPRLIAEINATQDIKLGVLMESMDLSSDEVNELFDRADTMWEKIKEASSTATGRFPNDPEAAHRYVRDLLAKG